MSAPRVTVVVPTYRRPDLLARCLQALLGQSLDPDDYEIVVVDDAPTADTRDLVRRLAAQCRTPIVYATAPATQGPAGARNRGWRAAAAPIVAFTDDDTEPDRDWLAEGLAALDDPALVAVHGSVVVPVPRRPTDHDRMTQGLETAGFVTANCFVRTDALRRIGGFDERFRRAWREDSDLYFRLLDQAGPVGHAPRAVVVHPVRRARWGISLGQQENVVFDALLYRKHPVRYRRFIRPRPPWRYYAIVGASLAAAALWLSDHSWLAGGALVVAVAGIAQFAVQRLRGASRRWPHVAEMLVTSACIPFLSIYWRIAGSIRFRVLFL